VIGGKRWPDDHTRAVTDSQGSTTVYDAAGRVTGRTAPPLMLHPTSPNTPNTTSTNTCLAFTTVCTGRR
jgi:YD repeat-containing protein